MTALRVLTEAANEAHFPLVKVATAVGATAGATAVNVATPSAPAIYVAPFYSELLVLNWQTLSYATATILTVYTGADIFWRRIGRPFAENKGWIKPSKRKKLTKAEKQELLKLLSPDEIARLLSDEDTGHGELR